MSLKEILKYLRSLYFSLILLALLIILSAISTFSSDPGAFFNSLGFFAIIFLFFVNLVSCTVYRLVKEIRKKSNRNFGPDILHGGLILFMVFALLSTYNRMEGQIALTVGQSVNMPDGSVLTLDDFEYLRYDDGRPQDWISYLSVENAKGVVVSRYPLRVNHPLQLSGLTLYQSSYGEMRGGVYSVIMAVKEPLWILVLAALIICGAGMFITLFVKLYRTQRRKTGND
ncbi:MAG: cytochrome c biogenesis protein ResB [Treponema sp.]|nr:cytochrome c biogenesis protein ResB [Treponema sp.]